MLCVITTKRLLPSVDGPDQGLRPQSTTWTDPTRVENFNKSTKRTDPTDGQDQSTKWTDLTRVTNLNKSTKWTDPTKGQDHSPQRGQTQRGQRNLNKSTKWTDPTKG